MPIPMPERILRSLNKTPIILKAVLSNVTQEQARQATDGPKGWSVIETLCHMLDYETIVYARACLMLEGKGDELPGMDNEELTRLHDYASQKLDATLASYIQKRQLAVTLYGSLTPDQWHLEGQHPDFGMITLLEMANNICHHDINHIEQIVHTLGLAESTL